LDNHSEGLFWGRSRILTGDKVIQKPRRHIIDLRIQ
jgi:hypothetical protein